MFLVYWMGLSVMLVVVPWDEMYCNNVSHLTRTVMHVALISLYQYTAFMLFLSQYRDLNLTSTYFRQILIGRLFSPHISYNYRFRRGLTSCCCQILYLWNLVSIATFKVNYVQITYITMSQCTRLSWSLVVWCRHVLFEMLLDQENVRVIQTSLPIPFFTSAVGTLFFVPQVCLM